MSKPTVSQIRNLFAKLKNSDPSSHEGLMQILAYLEKQEDYLFPIIEEFNAPSTNIPVDPSNFSASIQGNGVLFTWMAGSGGVTLYEIRRGSNWDTADFVLRTSSLNALIEPLTVGSYTFLLRGLSSSGVYSNATLSQVVTITAPSAVSLTSSVIDNNVLLYWDVPSSLFNIDYYVVTQDGSEVGRLTGTFTPITLVAAGTYVFGVYAVDVAGNVGALGTVSVQVSQPPDYVLENEFISNLTGTRINCFRFT